jgi:glycosyltransferase involved in cell wall biosynthesis
MPETLRIAIVSKALAPGGGASRMAEMLGNLLRDAGHAADNWVGYYTGPPLDHVRQLHGRRIRPMLRGAQRLVRNLGLQEAVPFEYPMLRPHAARYDIIHFHDIIHTASPASIRLLARTKPVAVTLHDCSSITGGCIQPMDCPSYPTACGRCPEHGRWPLVGRFDATRALRSWKKRLWRHPGIAFIAPSRWMTEQADESGMLPASPRRINNAVETDIFAPPTDKHALRRDLGLPADKPVAVLSSGALDDRYKGVDLGLMALLQADPKPHVLLIGKNAPSPGLLEGLDWKITGYLDDRRVLARYMGAGDVFVHPSRADNQPLATLEALAAGLPVAAFAVGGVPEYVVEGETGALARPDDVDELSACISRLLNNQTALAAMSAKARRVALELFSPERFLSAHLALYDELLQNREAGGTATDVQRAGGRST